MAAVESITALYEIDRRGGGDRARLADLRRTESAAVLARLKDWLWGQAVLKTLSIGKAAAYAIGNGERLTRGRRHATLSSEESCGSFSSTTTTCSRER